MNYSNEQNKQKRGQIWLKIWELQIALKKARKIADGEIFGSNEYCTEQWFIADIRTKINKLFLELGKHPLNQLVVKKDAWPSL